MAVVSSWIKKKPPRDSNCPHCAVLLQRFPTVEYWDCYLTAAYDSSKVLIHLSYYYLPWQSVNRLRNLSYERHLEIPKILTFEASHDVASQQAQIPQNANGGVALHSYSHQMSSSSNGVYLTTTDAAIIFPESSIHKVHHLLLLLPKHYFPQHQLPLPLLDWEEASCCPYCYLQRKSCYWCRLLLRRAWAGASCEGACVLSGLMG